MTYDRVTHLYDAANDPLNKLLPIIVIRAELWSQGLNLYFL